LENSTNKKIIEVSDSLEFLKKLEDNSVDINYSDPPYALGSEIIIRKDGKPDYSKAVDFMNKWKMPGGEYWESWFKEAYRSLKHGGYCIMFGIDRTQFMFEYYANLAGFRQNQSIYWYFLSSFPKSADLSKNLDQHFGEEREVIGEGQSGGMTSLSKTRVEHGYRKNETNATKNFDITSPSSILAKKYEGYKYSIAPLKQTCETIMVFQKPYKSGSCLHDTLAYENGDESCCCGALNIDGNRVPFENTQNAATNPKYRLEMGYKQPPKGKDSGLGFFTSSTKQQNLDGRYPAQTFIDSGIAEILDRQHPNVTGGSINKGTVQGFGGSNHCYGDGTHDTEFVAHNDTGGASKILHKCDYEKLDFDLYQYCRKVSTNERNAGLDEFEDNTIAYSEYRENYDTTKSSVAFYPDGSPRPMNKSKNNHPTVKPISLCHKIASLFFTPNPQKIVYPFAGVGSEIIGGEKAGFTDWTACEISEDFATIGNARIDYWRTINYDLKNVPKKQTNKTVVEPKIQPITETDNFLLDL
jgi:DNA modification methylase